MATTLKTVEYVFDGTSTSVAGGVSRTLVSSTTIYIPETTSRTFVSAYVVVCIRDASTAASMTSWSLTATVGGTGGSAHTVTNTPANSGEQQSFILTFDVTGDFTSNFGAGSSATFSAAMTIGGLTTRVTGVKLVVTYEYDTSATTRVKTVRIPINSTLDTFTTSTTLDSLPALDTFLPEASKTYRCIAFELYANEATSVTTDMDLTLELDSEGATAINTFEQGLNSSCFDMITWRRDDMATNSTHTLKAASNVAGFCGLGGMLVVTYEYDHSSTTSVMNSLMLAVGDCPGFLGGTVAGDETILERDFFIEEPGTITMKNSAVWMTYNISVNRSIPLKVGAQSSYTTYQGRAGTLTCGCMSLVHRIDGDHANGEALTLARGLNTLTAHAYCTNNVGVTNASMVLILNYTSSVATAGDHVHNQTRMLIMREAGAQGQLSTTSWNLPIPEADYWLTGCIIMLIYSIQNTATGGFAFIGEYGSGEGPGAGWFDLYNSIYLSDNERATTLSFMMARSQLKRHPLDPDPDRCDIETSRTWRFHTTTNTVDTWMALVTYHCHTWSVAGTISGYSGDGSDIMVKVYRADNNEFLYYGNTAAGGGFDITVYDNVLEYYATAYQSGTKVGRSANSTPT